MHLIVIAVPVPQIQEQVVDLIKVIPEEWMSKRTVEQIVDGPVQSCTGLCHRMSLSSATLVATWTATVATGGSQGASAAEAQTRHQDFHAKQARVRGKSLANTFAGRSSWCRSSSGPCRPTSAPLRTSLMSLQPGFVSASPLGSTFTAVCCASSTSNSSPKRNGRGSSTQPAALLETRGDLHPPQAERG